MIHLVTYADHRMTRAKELCVSSALKHGVDNYCSIEVGNEFKELNEEIFQHERGAGYWLWKPYVIYKSMQGLKEGDILVYSDAGVEFVNSVRFVIDRMDEDIFFFTNGFKHVEWCKKDVYSLICTEIDRPDYTKTLAGCKQVQASVIFLRSIKRQRIL